MRKKLDFIALTQTHPHTRKEKKKKNLTGKHIESTC